MKIKSLLLLAIFCGFFLNTSIASAKYSGGTGEPNDPYKIATAQDLINLGNEPNDYDKHFVMTSNIYLSGHLFDKALIAWDTNPDDTDFQGTPFAGTFDGNGYIIYNLQISGKNYLGMFGKVGPESILSNISIESGDVNGTGDYVGGMVGYNSGDIFASSFTGKVNGHDYIGGLIGYNLTSNINSCFSIGEVSGNYYVGGLLGYNATETFSEQNDIYSSYSRCTVIGIQDVGGLIGIHAQGGIYTSYSSGQVNGQNYTGGMIARSGRICYFKACFWDIETSELSTSEGATGKTTAEMYDINTFLNAHWDLMGETKNGTDDIWWIDSGSDYPRLWWELERLPLKYSGGTGEPNDPYKIITAQDLIDLGNEPNDYDKCFIQYANIDLSEYLFDRALIAPDTNSSSYYFNGHTFNGTYNGQGYIINNLQIQGQDYLGMFGKTGSDAIIMNVSLKNTYVNNIEDYTGSLVGYNEGSIISCNNVGVVVGNNTTGGLAGRNEGNITLSHNAGAVIGNINVVGGLVGSNSNGTIISCYNSGQISGTYYAGGLVGVNYSGKIISSYSTGYIPQVKQYVGGLVGANCNPRSGCGFVTSSFWDIQTSGQSTSDGGTGLTTAQMKNINTYLNAGWDFVGEKNNGTNDFWYIQENNYPQLKAFSEYAKYELQGSGTIDDPYLIYDSNDLGIVWFHPEKHYRVEANIDLSDITWNQAVVPWFDGILDGNDHIIQSLHIEGYGYLGLFGKLNSNAEISNIALETTYIYSPNDYIGGLAGYNNGGKITSSYLSGIVTGKNYVGGLVGYDDQGHISSSYNTATTIGNNYIGGLIGYCSHSSSILFCCNKGTITGNDYIGGLIGYNGSNNISFNYNNGSVTGNSYIGGLLGINSNRTKITTNYSTGLVEGNDEVGGLIGNNGRNNGAEVCFWDVETSGQITSAGGTGKTTAEMQDISTFLDAGWDFIGETDNGTEDIWWIDDGQDYPRLWWEHGSEY